MNHVHQLKSEKRRNTIVIFAMLAAVIVVGIACLFVGSSKMSIGDALDALLGGGNDAQSRIIWKIRIPRVLAAIIAGAGLSVAGLVMQSTLNNSMASPSTLGVSNAAVFGANLSIIAFAGGSGITPFLSMAYAIRDGLEDFNLTILFGSRTEDAILFRKELDSICAATDKVKVVHVLSDEVKEGFENGFLSAELIKKYAPEGDYSVFICGPEAMYRFVAGEVEKLGLDKKHVRRELLGVTKKVWEQPGYPVEKKDQTFKITVKQGPNEYVCDASANESVLVALERAGIKAPSRCRSGECGWCRSRLISGDVFIPEETDGRRWADKVADEIHPCASFPLSDLELIVPGEYY